MKNSKELIEKYKDEAVELLRNLVSYASVLDEYKPNSDAPFGLENKKVLNFLLNKALADGFKVKNVDNYAGHIEFGSGTETLGILAHLDVVPVNKSEWVSDPFILDIRDDKFFGRGSIDDKGPLVASYIAMKILLDMGFKPKRQIRLIVGCDEESGSRCLEHYFKYEKKPELGFSPDADFPLIYGEKAMMSYDIIGNVADDIIDEFICGERYNIVPSVAKCKLKIDLKDKFINYLKQNNYEGKIEDDYLIIYGKASHAAWPQNGINAAYLMFDFLKQSSTSKLAKFVDEYFIGDVYGKKMGYDLVDPEMKELTSNFAIVEIKDDKLKIGVNCRIPVDSQIEVVEKCVKAATLKYGYLYKVINKSNRHYVSPKSELVKTLMKSYQNVTGDVTSKPLTIGGGTYARELGNAVAFGALLPGREDVCHIANEYMYIDDFYKAIEIYLDAIYELCK